MIEYRVDGDIIKKNVFASAEYRNGGVQEVRVSEKSVRSLVFSEIGAYSKYTPSSYMPLLNPVMQIMSETRTKPATSLE